MHAAPSDVHKIANCTLEFQMEKPVTAIYNGTKNEIWL
jgi:hypothetical protein